MNVLDVQYVFAGLDLLDLHMFVLQCIYGVYRKQGRRGDADSPATLLSLFLLLYIITEYNRN